MAIGETKRPMCFIAMLLVTILFSVCVFNIPNWIVQDDLDFGNSAALSYWFINGAQWGIDVIQNVGPLGFVNNPLLIDGQLDGLRVTLTAFITISFCYLALVTMRKHKTATALFIVASSALTFADVLFYVTMAVVAHILIFPNRKVDRLLAASILATLALTKGVFLFAGLMIAGISLGVAVARRSRFDAMLLGVFFPALFGSIWILSGQDLRNIPLFVRSIIEFSVGYQNAFQDDTLLSSIWIAAGYVFFLALCIVYGFVGALFRQRGREATILSVAWVLCMSIVVFIVWKHSIIRLSGHIEILFSSLLLCSFLIIWSDIVSVDDTSMDDRKIGAFLGHKARWALQIIGILLYIGGLFCYWMTAINAKENLGPFPRAAYRHGFHRLAVGKELLNLGLSGYIDKYKKRLDASIAQITDPALTKRIGTDKVGYFGTEPMRMLYQDFNYKTPPSTGSHTAWTPWIIERDAEYYRNETTAPRYVVFGKKHFGGSLFFQTSTLSTLELLHRYEPVLERNEVWVLKRKIDETSLLWEEMSKGEAKMGAWIDLPTTRDPLWARIHLNRPVLSSLVSIFYRAESYYISIEYMNGRTAWHRFLPKAGESGFLINPLLENAGMMRAMYNPGEIKKFLETSENAARVKRIRISCDKKIPYCAKDYEIGLDRITNLSLAQ